MFGCESAAAARASRRNRSRRSGSPATLGGQHLDRDGAAEPRVARAVDLAHPAGADPIEDLVVPEGLEHGTATIILTVPSAERLPRRLLRTNRNFRLLYIGQTISQLGDWFNAVAVYALLLDLTGSATAVAG